MEIAELLQHGLLKASFIPDKARRELWELAGYGEKIDMAKITEMRREKRIAANRKTTDEQLVDDLNGVLNTLQKTVLRTMLTHIDETDRPIKSLDAEIDRNRKDEEKIAAATLQEIPGIENTLLQSTLIVCAHSATRVKNSCFYAQFQRIRGSCTLFSWSR